VTSRALPRYLLLGALAWLMLALGGVHTWAQVPALGLVLAGILVEAWQRRGASVPLPGLVVLGAAGVLWTLVLVVPLPFAWVEALSPPAAVRYRALADQVGSPVDRVPLSLDAYATLDAALRYVLYVLVLALSWLVARHRHRAERLISWLGLLGVVLAGLALLHTLGRADAILFVFRPPQGDVYRALTTFVNPNHAAAFVGMTAALTLGRLVFDERRGTPRRLLAGSFVVQEGLLLLLPSGNAIVKAVLVPLLVALLLVLRRLRERRDRRRLEWLFPLAVAIAGVASFILLFFDDFFGAELKSGKYVLMGRTFPIVADFWRLGGGPGAFRFYSNAWFADAMQRYPSPENVLLYVLADYGLPVGLALLFGVLALMAIPLWRGASRTASLGAVAALLAFGLHELADFAFQMPAVGALASAVVGVVLGLHSREGRWTPRLALPPWALAAGAVTLAAVGGLGAPWAEWAGQRIELSRGRFEAPERPSAEAVQGHGRWYPLEDRVWIREARRAEAAGDRDRARRLFRYVTAITPQRPDAWRHWIEAERPDAAVHDELVARVMALAVRDYHPLSTLRRFLFEEILRTPALASHPRQLLGDSPALVARYLDAARPQSPAFRRAVAEALLADYAEVDPVMAVVVEATRTLDDPRLYARAVGAFLANADDSPEAWTQAGYLAQSLKRPDQAIQQLQMANTLAGSCEVRRCRRLFDLLVTKGDLDAAGSVLDLLAATAPQGATVDILRARLLAARGRASEALARLDAVLATTPSNRDALSARLSVLVSIGADVDALELARRLRKKGPSEYLDRLIEQLTKKIQRRR
jgi:tetratricopeptide (TPR) repeat protein